MAHSLGDFGGGPMARAPDAGEAYFSSHRSDGSGGGAALGAAAAPAPDDEEWERAAAGLRSSAEARWG